MGIHVINHRQIARLFDPDDYPVTHQGGIVTMGKDEQRTLHEYMAQNQQGQVRDTSKPGIG